MSNPRPYEWRMTEGEVELRDGEGDGSPVIRGYAAVFNSPTMIYGIRETVDPHAFDKTLNESDIRGLFNHNVDAILGRLRAGTMRLRTDEHGLAYEIDQADTSVCRDLAVWLKRGDVTGSSFGFRPVRWEETEGEGGTIDVRLLEVECRDVGPVTFPAYVATEAALRSIAVSRNIEFDAVREAAHEGALPALIRARSGASEERDEVIVGRETPTANDVNRLALY